MSRPCCCRRVAGQAPRGLFKPAGVPAASLQEVVLTLDELEALRLADLEGLYQEQAAEQMNVSRQTFARIVESARGKVAHVLVQAKALRIEGGVIEMVPMRKFVCSGCQHEWEAAHGTPRPGQCPQCGGANIHRSSDQCAHGRAGRHGGHGHGRCCRRQGRTTTPGRGAEPAPT